MIPVLSPEYPEAAKTAAARNSLLPRDSRTPLQDKKNPASDDTGFSGTSLMENDYLA